MENVRKGRIAVFTRKYLTKLLLAAVILTAGFSLRFVALAKYTSYLYDFTGAVASDFCFTSNYLDETGDKLYRISKWDGSDYSLDLELRNYENALRYNKANVDTCYYLDVEVEYRDGDDWKVDEQAQVTITGKTDGSPCIEGEYTNGKTCFLLEGIDDSANDFEFSRKSGTHNIKIEIKNFGNTGYMHRITVTAKTIPASEKDEIDTSGADVSELTSYTGYGVYDITLSGTFQLEKDEIKPVITQSCTRPDVNSLAMVYTLTCTSLGSGTPTVRIYYNPNVIEPDSTMVQKSSDGIKDADDYKGYKYVTIQIQSNSITRCWLFSKDLTYNAENAINKKEEGGLPDVFCEIQMADGPGG